MKVSGNISACVYQEVNPPSGRKPHWVYEVYDDSLPPDRRLREVGDRVKWEDAINAALAVMADMDPLLYTHDDHECPTIDRGEELEF